MSVKVQLIQNRNWPNITKYPGCFEWITPYIMKHSGHLYTGFNDSNEDLRLELEKRLHTDLSEKSEYWATFFIKLNDEELTLNEKDAFDLLRITFLKGHAECATPDTKGDPTKKFIVIDEEKEAKNQNAKSKARREVFRVLDELTNQDIYDALRLYGFNPDGTSPAICAARLDELVEKDPKKFKEIWIDNPNRQVNVLFHRAVNAGVIRKNRGIYTYGSDTLGSSQEAAISYLVDDRNTETRQAIIIQLNGGKLPSEESTGAATRGRSKPAKIEV